MSYLKELKIHRRPLAAAMLGLGAGFSFTAYTASIMAPHLLKEFGWSRGDFAAVGTLSLPTVIAFPIIGRLSDVIGVRRTALIGVLALPLTFTAYSLMHGSLREYMLLYFLQSLLCVTTTATVYSRVVVQYVTRARGIALAVVASGPAVTGMIFHPQLNKLVEAYGWRAGYLALAAFTGLVGGLALLMLPPDRKHGRVALSRPGSIREDYPAIFKTPAFWLLGGSMLLCNLPQVVALSQLTLVLQENGLATADAGVAISMLSVGMLAGRFACGVALDRFPAQIVAAIGMVIPTVGLLLLASNLDAPPVLALAVLLLGMSLGAEGDIVGFLVVRNFGVAVYSSVFGLLTLIISASTASGAALVSFMLERHGSFTLFLLVSATAVFLGSLLLLPLRTPVTLQTLAGPTLVPEPE